MAMNLFEKMAQAYSKRNHAAQQLSNLDKQAIRRMQMKDWANKRDKFNELAKRLEVRKVVADNDIIGIPSQQLEKLHEAELAKKNSIGEAIDEAKYFSRTGLASPYNVESKILKNAGDSDNLKNATEDLLYEIIYNPNLDEKYSDAYQNFLNEAGYNNIGFYKPQVPKSDQYLVNRLNDIESRYK